MKLASIKEQTIANISLNRYDCQYPSMSLDVRGFPHVVWFENRGGSYVVNYKFWDGLKWSFLGQTSVVAKSGYNISNSNQNIMIDQNQNPIICFGENLDNGSNIALSYGKYSFWDTNKYFVDYKIKWVGITIIRKQYDFSSSGSSSLSYSSQSRTSTSSSIESASSDSYDDPETFIATIDEDNQIRIYKLENEILTLVVQKQVDENWIDFKIHSCGNNIGFTFFRNGHIYYDFFDVNTFAFLNANWGVVTETAGGMACYDSCGGIMEDNGMMLIAWNEDLEDTSCVKSKILLSNGVQRYTRSDSLELEEKLKIGMVANSFVVNVTKKISCSISASNDYYITCLGDQSKTFYVTSGENGVYNVDIVGLNRFVPESVTTIARNGKLSCVFENGSDVYFMRGNIEETSIPYIIPKFSILSWQRYQNGFLTGNVFSGQEIRCVWDNRTGDILREAKNRVIVTANENNDPLCESSSSSLSSLTSQSSKSSGSSVTFDKVSSSSLDYSESTEGISETSGDFTDGEPSSAYELRFMPPIPKTTSGPVWDQMLSQDMEFRILTNDLSSSESSLDESTSEES